MTVHALPGAATLAACSQLFRHYPLAVAPQSADGGSRSMVLMNRAAEPPGYFVLTQADDDHFVIRSWNHRDGVNEEIRPGEPVSAITGFCMDSDLVDEHGTGLEEALSFE